MSLIKSAVEIVDKQHCEAVVNWEQVEEVAKKRALGGVKDQRLHMKYFKYIIYEISYLKQTI